MLDFTHCRDDNRIGEWDIPRSMYVDDPSIVAEICSEALITRAEMLMYDDVVRFQGYSPNFDPIAAGFVIPRYHIEITTDYDEEQQKIFVELWEWKRSGHGRIEDR